MQRVYTSSNFVLIGQLQEVLSSYGIGSFVKNQHLFGAIGELPEFECWPELWVTDDADRQRAIEVVSAYVAQPLDDRPGWTCPSCAEDIEPPFDSCWNCGTDRPPSGQDASDPQAGG